MITFVNLKNTALKHSAYLLLKTSQCWSFTDCPTPKIRKQRPKKSTQAIAHSKSGYKNALWSFNHFWKATTTHWHPLLWTKASKPTDQKQKGFASIRYKWKVYHFLLETKTSKMLDSVNMAQCGSVINNICLEGRR